MIGRVGYRGLLLLFVLGGGESSTALASVTYSHPFHPEQCELALTAGNRALARNADDRRARTLLAEGFLCRGLERDDPWALEEAIEGFQQLRSADGADFFTQLYLAEALRRRFPLSDATVDAFRQASTLLIAADVGAGRGRLTEHVNTSLRAVQEQRQRVLPMLRERLLELERGPPKVQRLGELFTLLAQTGPAGATQALEILDQHLVHNADGALDTFYRAELLRGRRPPAAVAALYRSAADVLCRGDLLTPSRECTQARWRLEQLEIARGQQGGYP